MMRVAARYAAFATKSDDLPGLEHEACRAAAEGLGTGFARLLIHDDATQDFLIQAGVGWRPGVVGQSRLAADSGTAAGLARNTGRPVVCNTLGHDGRFRTPGLLVEHGLVRSVDVPVPGDAHAAGVLEVGSPQRGEFAGDDVCFLDVIAHSLGDARRRLSRQASFGRRSAHDLADRQMALNEIHHRIRNDLQGICAGIEREMRRLDDEEQRAGYRRVSRRVLCLASLYDHLIGAHTGDTVEMGAYLRSLCARIASATDLASRHIALSAETQAIEMSTQRAGRVAVAINELIANAAEHAFPNGRTGTIVVRLFARIGDGSGCPVVTVSDDGCGFSGPRPGGAGLGFVDRLVRGAGGMLIRVDGPGTQWQVALPS